MTNEILKAFLYNDRLKFNEIEKLTSLRSNALAYHLKNLENEGVITKENGEYFLSGEFEHIIPYVSEKPSTLTTILIAVGDGKKFFLPLRKKKPYMGYLGMPAGRLLVGESIAQAVERIMRNKHGLNARLKNVNSVSIEHIRKDNKVIHSFLQILVTASTKDEIELLDLEKNKKIIIKSDYLFLRKHFKLKYKIETINSK